MSIREAQPFTRDPIDVRCFDLRLGVVTAGVAESHIVRHDQNDVRMLRLFKCRSQTWYSQRRDGERHQADETAGAVYPQDAV